MYESIACMYESIACMYESVACMYESVACQAEYEESSRSRSPSADGAASSARVAELVTENSRLMQAHEGGRS